jgi:hypothetical protein
MSTIDEEDPPVALGTQPTGANLYVTPQAKRSTTMVSIDDILSFI